MGCGTFWKRKYKNMKNVGLTFFKLQSIDSDPVNVTRDTHLQFQYTEGVIYNKLYHYCQVLQIEKRFVLFDTMSNCCETSPLWLIIINSLHFLHSIICFLSSRVNAVAFVYFTNNTIFIIPLTSLLLFYNDQLLLSSPKIVLYGLLTDV